MRHKQEYLSPRSSPAVTFGCCLLPSMVGRSSFPYWASEPVERLQTQRVLRMGVGLLISSSENVQKAKFAEFLYYDVREYKGERKKKKARSLRALRAFRF